MKTYRTFSSAETKRLGSDFVKMILKRPPQRRSALVAVFQGALGSGKTVFVQGALQAAGVRKCVVSPTFLIIRRFPLESGPYRNAFHLDCYRVKRARELLALGLEKIFSDPGNMVFIEWPERIRRAMPRVSLAVRFTHGERENERRIRY